MESREKCEQIIQMFNGNTIPGAKDPLLVKFADGGPKKKNLFKTPDPNARAWRDVSAEGIPVTYDPTMQQNGVSVNVGTPIGVPYSRFGAPQVGGYPVAGSQWIPGYMMTQPITQVDDQVSKVIIKRNANAKHISVFLFYHAVHANGCRSTIRRYLIQTGSC